VHEIYSSEGFLTKTEDWKIYHKAHHTSSKEIGLIANQLGIETLVLSHILYWGANDKSILFDVGKNFSGNTIIASDLIVID
jgi:ribonuclease BN (tRNA processing enzyme)